MSPWRLLPEPESEAYERDPAFNLALEEAILAHVASGRSPPTLRLWRNGPCVVLGRFDHPRRLPRLREALLTFQAEGVPVVRRSSGGGAVWHDPTCLSVSAVAPGALVPRGVHACFASLAEGLLRALGLLGLEGAYGRVSGAFCDGPHNVLIRGRKVAGTAQVRRRGAALVHATLLVDVDLERMHEHLERFYRLAGRHQGFCRERVTTLARELGRPLPWEELTGALRAGYAQAQACGPLREGSLSEGELRLARSLRDQVAVIE